MKRYWFIDKHTPYLIALSEDATYNNSELLKKMQAEKWAKELEKKKPTLKKKSKKNDE